MVKKVDVAEPVTDLPTMRKRVAESGVGAVCLAIAKSLARTDEVAVVGLGRLTVRSRRARETGNVRTAKAVSTGPSGTLNFKVAKALKNGLIGAHSQEMVHCSRVFCDTRITDSYPS